MTMTSLSVIMAVIVINLYNRGHKTKRAPAWLRRLILGWMSKFMFLKHDLIKFAKDVILVSINGVPHTYKKSVVDRYLCLKR